DHEAHRPDHLGDRTIEAAMAMRKAAAKAFFETDCDQALRNALSAGPRPQIEYHVGQMVYFYRIGHSKKGRKLPDLWCGPARVVLLDMPGTLWLSYQGGIVKASPERVRPASPEEQLTVSGWLAGLTRAKEDFEATPKRGYLDLSQDPLPEYHEEVQGEEDRGDGPHGDDPDEDVSYGDRMIPPQQDRDEGTTGGEADDGPEPSRSSWESLPRTRPHGELPDDETPGPPTKKSRTELLEIYYAKLETLMKTRQRKEVRLKELNKHDLDCFIRAAEKEIKNNLETQAYEILGPEESEKVRAEKPERIMDSRFVRTAKPLEESDLDKARADGLLLAGEHGGPCKAKVRHVMKGFSENGAEELDAATPQVTRDGVIAVTQIIVGQGWRLGFLDFTQAFHSGDPISRELYAEQPPEGIPGLQRGQLLRLRKTCCGLLDGPMAWFQHLRRVLTQENGWKSLEGIISVATDDMLHGGGARHQEKMEYLNKTYKLGKFQYGEGRFTGKNFKPLPCGGVLIEQDHYVKEKIEAIPIAPVRNSQRYSMCNEKEIGELRSLVGGLAWLAKETRPDLCGRVCLLQQAFPRPRVRDLIQANQLATEAMKYPAGIKVSKIPLDRLRISTVTDASWGNAAEPMTGKDPDYWVETQSQWIRYHVRPRRTLFHPGMTDDGPVKLMETGPWIGKTVFDKGSTTEANIHEGFLQNRRLSSQGGHIILYHDKDLQYEPWAKVTVASWKSYKLKRKVVNTLAAEWQALVSGVGNLQWHRFLFSEAQNDPVKDRDWERKLSNIPFLAVTDSKSLYDTLSKQTCPFSQVDDKRTAIDVSILKHDLEGAGTVRWIDGRNMISDNLTKNA
ncbi:RE2, partial [Symbiodinium necroappetens]